jgi:hypothetical protein
MKFSLRLFVLIAALTALGCGGGDKRVALSGKVTVGGKGPLTGGNIRFVSTADPNRVGGGLIKADGTYEVTDAPVGACKVVIDNTHLDPNAVKAVNLPGMGGPGMKGVPGAPPGIKMPGGAARR